MDLDNKLKELSKTKILLKKKTLKFKNIEKHKQNCIYDEYAEYWAAPDEDLTDNSLEGKYSKLSFEDFCNLFGFNDKLNILEKDIEYKEHVTKMVKEPWNYWSPLDPEEKGDVAGIAPGGFLIRRM